MNGNRLFIRMRLLRFRATTALRSYFDRRTPRQRVCLAVGMLLLFAAADLWLIVKASFFDGNVIEHIQPLKP